MKSALGILTIFGLLFSSVTGFASVKVEDIGRLLKVEAAPKRGFNFPFFLYVPNSKSKKVRLLVRPNNSGSDSYSDLQTLQSARREALSWGDLADQTSSVLLVPVFPRPNIDPPIYTHALSASTLRVSEGPLKRIDHQLIMMIEASRSVLAERFGKTALEKVNLLGFSASGMFVNRFAFIHPEMVNALVFGSPGGWPLAPIAEYKKRTLSYPVGISDLPSIIGKPLDLALAKKIHIFAFLGALDENDSVTFRDGYTKEQQDTVFELFGPTLPARWSIAESIYKELGLKAEFKLYPKVGHEVDKRAREEIIEFLNRVEVK